MTSITEELVRKRSEHNEGQIGTLEELSLSQDDVIKIDNIQNWCRGLKILYLQLNIISKIENLGKLKRLEYLNLTLNNIERVENLEGCESLNKLDLTLNFVGEITSLQSLKNNFNLKELYLTGNPCSYFEGYREYIIGILPQLDVLDGESIFRLDKTKAGQNLMHNEEKIIKQQKEYLEKRKIQKQSQAGCLNATVDSEKMEEVRKFWSTNCENTPETRNAIAEQNRKCKKDNTVDLSSPVHKRKFNLFRSNGCPLNVNQAKIPFTLKENGECYILIVEVYKYIDTSLIDVDVQPWFVRVIVKGKVFQLVLSSEVHPDSSKAQRTIGSRKLVITMPKFHENEILKFKKSGKES